MKRILYFGILLGMIFSSCISHAGDIEWLDNFEKAKELSVKEGRPILVNFTGSDWCIWCKRLAAEVFSQESFKDYAEKNLILLIADFPRMKAIPEDVAIQNRKMAEAYGIQGFPTIVLMNSGGKELARTGYQRGGAEAYIEHLKDLLK